MSFGQLLRAADPRVGRIAAKLRSQPVRSSVEIDTIRTDSQACARQSTVLRDGAISPSRLRVFSRRRGVPDLFVPLDALV